MTQLQDTNVKRIIPLISPGDLKKEIFVNDLGEEVVLETREAIKKILTRDDKRFIVIVGPCSIHDKEGAIEYAKKLAQIKNQLPHFLILMRTYFEKPRSSTGWKGLTNDPHMDESLDLEHGLRVAREIGVSILDLGLPLATELLHPVTTRYIADLISWGCIGARTVESQTHRELASGLSVPVGLKNSTNGSVAIASNALRSASQPHSFLGINDEGQSSIVSTEGNPWCHVVLRGGDNGPNYDSSSIKEAVTILERDGCRATLLIDCSHGNSQKDYTRQAAVFEDVLKQRVEGNEHIVGVLLESNLLPGRQEIPKDLSQLKKGVSVTDGCVGWDETKNLLTRMHDLYSRPLS